jgi:hypothetical protein
MNNNQVFYFILLVINAITAATTSIPLLQLVALVFVCFCGAMISMHRDRDDS